MRKFNRTVWLAGATLAAGLPAIAWAADGDEDQPIADEPIIVLGERLEEFDARGT